MNTNELTQLIHATLYPRAALIVYATDEDRQYFLEVRTIDSTGRLSEGKPVTVDFMHELAKNYSEIQTGTPHGLIPSNLLWCDTRKGSEKYIWYNPPRKRMMYFKQSLGIENEEYNLPGIIYCATENRLHVYAYKGQLPTEDTELFAAPFFNVSGSDVCLGHARIDKPHDLTYRSLLEYWEKMFWLTEFSHLGGNGNPTKSNLVLVTKAAKDNPFNMNELKPLKNMKLKDILQ